MWSDIYSEGRDDGWELAPIRHGASADYLQGYIGGIADADDDSAAVGIQIAPGSQVGRKRRRMLSEARRLLRNLTSDVADG